MIAARSRAALRTGGVVAFLLTSLVGGSPAGAKVYLTQERALEVAFGLDARVEREAIFLTDEQVDRARRFAGPDVAIEGALVARYRGYRGGVLVGTAYFDTHRVRTLEETLMVVVAPDDRIARLEILAFGEPEDYLPRPRWYEQFDGRSLDRNLAVSRGIHGITGATLSARAATEAARRILAIHRALEGPDPSGP